MNAKLIQYLKWAMKDLLASKFRLVLMLSLSASYVACALGEIYVLQLIISSLLNGSDKNILFLVGLLGIILLAKVLFQSLLDIAGQYLYQFPIIKSISDRVLNKLFCRDISMQKEVFVDILTQDVCDIGKGITCKIKSLSYFLQIFLIIILLFKINIPMLAITSILVILYLIIYDIFSKKFIKARCEYMSDVSLIHKVTEEGVSSSKEVLAYNRMDWETNRRVRMFERYYKKTKKLYHMGNLQYFVTSIFKWMIVLFILFYGGFLVLKGKMSVAVFVAAYQYCNLLISNIECIYSEATDIPNIIAKINRIQEVLNKIPVDNGSERVDQVKSIEFCNVSFCYDSKEENTLNNINFEISDNKKIALVGPSGSGKSTVIKLLLGVLKPTSGVIKINGIDMNQLDKTDWIGSKAVACFQEPYIFEGTILNNIQLGEPIEQDVVNRACRSFQILDYIMRQNEGFSSKVLDQGVNLSGGEKQRLALARLFSRKANVYLLDEPTSGIDILNETKIVQSMSDFVNENHAIVVLSAHRLVTIRDSDSILVMDHGQIVQNGTHKSLLCSEGLYRELWLQQERVM